MYRAAASLASKSRVASSSGLQIGGRFAWSLNSVTNDLKCGVEGRDQESRGLSDVVKANMGGKIPVYGNTLPRWFSAYAPAKPVSQLSPTEKKTVEEASKVVNAVVEHASHTDRKEVNCFSPLETISLKPRNGILGNESWKIKQAELSQKITFALIPALILISKSSLTTSLLVISVYWQIYGFFKEIFLDYVHQEVTRKWVLVYFQVLLLILFKDTLFAFSLV